MANGDWLGTREAVKYARYNPAYLKKLANDGKIVGGKENGKWRFSKQSIREYRDAIQAKKDARVEKYASGDYGKTLRPAERSCDMISGKVVADPNLSESQRTTFLQAIESYRAEWDAEYARMYPDRVAD